jgi:hypothetical protein
MEHCQQTRDETTRMYLMHWPEFTGNLGVSFCLESPVVIVLELATSPRFLYKFENQISAKKVV